jgi:type I restriction enzyme S subunit
MRLADFVEVNPLVKLIKGREYPFVEMAIVTPGRRYVSTDSKRVYKGGGARFQAGDTLFARITPCLEHGKIAQFSGREGEMGFGSTEFFVFRHRDGISDPGYVFYLACSDIVRKPTEKSMFGASGRQRADLSIVEELEVPAPPLPTQRKIAAILSAYDDLIENNTRRIAILEEMAQALYREWFVQFRFPGHEGVAMVDSELGPIPEGWEVVKLASIADVNAASIKGNEAPEQINYVNISSVSTGQIEKIEPMAFEDAPSRARRIVGHGDIIWSTVRPNRKSYCLILDPVPNMIVSTGFAVITARQVPYTYLYHALTTDEFVAYLTNHATGAAYPAVNTGDFENADVLLPAGEPVQTFHNIVADLFDEKQNLHERNEVLRRTRDLLLPRLISGEVDVSELEIKDLTGFENLSGLDTGGLDQ